MLDDHVRDDQMLRKIRREIAGLRLLAAANILLALIILLAL